MCTAYVRLNSTGEDMYNPVGCFAINAKEKKRNVD
jgi:hypothetical protein